jgi:hypothetical protein
MEHEPSRRKQHEAAPVQPGPAPEPVAPKSEEAHEKAPPKPRRKTSTTARTTRSGTTARSRKSASGESAKKTTEAPTAAKESEEKPAEG